MGCMTKAQWIAQYGEEHYKAHLKSCRERIKAKYANFTPEEKAAYLEANRPKSKEWYERPENKAKVIAKAAITTKRRRSTPEGRKRDNEIALASYHKAMADPEKRLVKRKQTAERTRKWREKNPEEHKIHTAATNARKRTSGTFNRQAWKDILQRQQGKCFDCGEEKQLEVGHLLPVKLGGSNDPNNLIGQCRQCNMVQGSKPHHSLTPVAC